MADNYDHTLEASVIKWMLENQNRIMQITLVEKDIHNELYREIFKAVVDLYSGRGYVDEKLLRSSTSGSIPAEAIDDVMASDTAGGIYYADQVKRLSNNRKLHKALLEGIEMVERQDDDAIDKFDQVYHKTRKNFDTIYQPLSAEEIAQKYEAHWETLKDGNGVFLRSGYDLTDDYVCWQPKKLYTIAARSSIGKSSLAQTLGVGFAKNNHKVLFFSLEMDYIELCERMLAIYAGVSNTKFKYGNVKRETMVEALKEFRAQQDNFYLHWDPTLNLRKIIRIANDMKNRIGLDVIVIDYLQLVRPHYAMKPTDSMHRFIGDLTSSFKQMAGELECAVIQLSQITRGGDEKSPPTLSQLKESGSIENDSDVVMMLHREHRDSEDAELLIAKNRSGPAMGTVHMRFKREQTLFVESEHQTLAPVRDVTINRELKSQLVYDPSEY